MTILTKKACEIILAEVGHSLQELASEPFNGARGGDVRLLYPEKARGSVRAMAGNLLMPETTERARVETSKFRLAEKSKGIQRLLRHFR